MPPIRYAKEQGHYIITCDYLPDNPGHQLADEYYNISTTDTEAVFELAAGLNLDAVVAFGSDVAALPAAFVAEKLGLPGNPYSSVRILTQKDLFRNFLLENDFNVPRHRGFLSFGGMEEYFEQLNAAVVVKPVDASGSKGVSKVTDIKELRAAFDLALPFSKVKRVIVEEFIEKSIQIAGDGFVLNGELVFRCFAKEHFNPHDHPFNPVGESFPLQLPAPVQANIHNDIDRLMHLLNMRGGALNFDVFLDKDQKVFLMEIGPRAGGNFIAELIKYSTGTDLARYAVDVALGLDCSGLSMYQAAQCYAYYTPHSQTEGYLEDIILDESVAGNVVETIMFVKTGDPIKSFENLGCTIGGIIFKFDTADEMIRKMDSMSERVKVRVRQ